MNGHLYFEIHADDTHRAADFYKKVFGWQFEEAKGLPVEYWRIETGGTMGGLLKRPAETPETAQRITNVGGQVALPKFACRASARKGIL